MTILLSDRYHTPISTYKADTTKLHMFSSLKYSIVRSSALQFGDPS